MSLSRRTFAASLAGTSLLRAQTTPAASKDQPASQQPDEWSPKLFDDHQINTVAAIAELIIPATDTPGARDAQVHRHLDEILFASPHPVQHSFLEGLSWLDGYCLRTEEKPFLALTSPQQAKVLLELHDSVTADLQPGREFVLSMKHWTSAVYYSTEIGAREINKGGRVPPSYASTCNT